MQSHEERISKHEVHDILAELINELKEALGGESYLQEILDEFSRELIILEALEQQLKSDNTTWFSIHLLNSTSEKIKNIRGALSSFRSSNHESYVENMMSYADQLLDLYRGVNVNKVDQYNIVKKYVFDIQYSVGKLSTQLHTTMAENIKLEELIKNQKNDVENLSKVITQTNSNLQESSEKRFTQLESNINEFKGRMEAEVDRLKQRNENSMVESLRSIDEKSNRKFQDLDILYNNKKEKLTQLYRDKDAELASYIDTVKTIAGQVNTTMFSYKYKQVADDAKKREIIWNGICLTTLVVASVVAYFTMTYMTEKINDSLFLYGAIARTVIIMIVLTASGYTAKQAANQGKIERYARKIEMELVAFDTFVEDMSEDIKKELKSEVVKRIFINREDIIDEKSDNNKDVPDMLKMILEKINGFTNNKQ